MYKRWVRIRKNGVALLAAIGLINIASPGTRLLRWKVKRSIVMITPKPQHCKMASILQSSQRWRKQLARECAALLPVHKGIQSNMSLKVKLLFNRLWYHTYHQRRVIYSVRTTYTKRIYKRLHTNWIYKRHDLSSSQAWEQASQRFSNLAVKYSSWGPYLSSATMLWTCSIDLSANQGLYLACAPMVPPS